MTLLRWLTALLACFPFFCRPAPEVGEDEFCLQVTIAAPQVYGLYTQYSLQGERRGDMGVRNADGSAFRHNEVISLTFDQELIPADSDLSDFCLQLYWIDREGMNRPASGVLIWPAARGEAYTATLHPDAEGGCFLEADFPCTLPSAS